MTDKGWIKLHRKLLDCWIWDIKPYDKARAWVDLLLLAVHHDKKIVIEGKPVLITRGSYFTSRGQLATRWGWSVKKVDSFLKSLEAEEMITTNKSKRGTIINIVNYKEYQLDVPKNDKNTRAAEIADMNTSEKAETISAPCEITQQAKDARKVIEEWNKLEAYGIKPITRISSGTKRYNGICARLKQYGIDNVLKAIEKIKESDFLQGKTNKGWTITFDWFVLPNNFPKVLDGNYSNKTGGKNDECIGRNANEIEDDQCRNELYSAFQ